MIEVRRTWDENPSRYSTLPEEAVSQYEKPALRERGEAVGWKKFRAVTSKRSDSGIPSI